MGWLAECNPSEEDERCIEEILLLEEELFQDDDRAVRWPIIQLYRNLLVAAMNTFILNPIYKTVAVIPVFLAFVVHDCFRKSFKHVYLNYLQIMTSVCLLVISVCNVLPANSTIFEVGSMEIVGKMTERRANNVE